MFYFQTMLFSKLMGAHFQIAAKFEYGPKWIMPLVGLNEDVDIANFTHPRNITYSFNMSVCLGESILLLKIRPLILGTHVWESGPNYTITSFYLMHSVREISNRLQKLKLSNSCSFYSQFSHPISQTNTENQHSQHTFVCENKQQL